MGQSEFKKKKKAHYLWTLSKFVLKFRKLYYLLLITFHFSQYIKEQ